MMVYLIYKTDFINQQSILESMLEVVSFMSVVLFPFVKAPLSKVEGRKSFNSGKPVRSNSYMYTFDDLGYFCVASQGAPGYAGTVNVINSGK